MLSANSATAVEATLPVVGEHLDTIASVFYDTMLGENPDLLNLFSRSGPPGNRSRHSPERSPPTPHT
jgi:nitric oxide dioxygenase